MTKEIGNVRDIISKISYYYIQKQPSEMFLWKKCSEIYIELIETTSAMENNFLRTTGKTTRHFKKAILYRRWFLITLILNLLISEHLFHKNTADGCNAANVQYTKLFSNYSNEKKDMKKTQVNKKKLEKRKW